MSGVRSTDDERARRRFPLVASVVAAVLVAGGGGVWLASSAGGDGGRGPAGGSGAGGELPKLPVSPVLSPAERIAPGEPHPAGGVLERRPGAGFPDAPDSAPVHRAHDGPKAADVAAAAGALGLAGPVRSGAGGWRAGPDADGTGAVLQVSARPPGAWSYGAHAGTAETDNCAEKAEFCSGPYVPPGPARAPGQPAAQPVTESVARQAAAPVLKALGLADAVVDARRTAGPTRIVTADPLLGGVRTRNYATVLHIGPDGWIMQANGFLSVPVKGKAYPLITADRALKDANAAALGGYGGGLSGPPACATAVPLDGAADRGARTEPDPANCGPARPAGARLPVTGAVLGLTAVHGTERVTFVPAWLFSVAPDGGKGAGYTVAQPAVEPRYLDRGGETTPGGKVSPTAPAPSPDAPKPPTAPTTAPGGSAVDSYRVDGRTLILTFYGGVCETYRATAEESSGTVRVTVKGTWRDPGKACIAIAKEQTAKAVLTGPLGDRKVVDASTGTAVRRG
ncbi:hypothetical protein ACIQ9E_19620 [Streptomyces sp. NPDC094448]|uniref:hypothetical protein n=1 Tax=Streptomyces sp. NPDC094448 TaxID=3366063 RepID=UPI00380C4CBF